ncbi:O-antigen ligase [Salinisphaera sp. LB1]|uniref:O-antigen ligase family protein n=1 Tax=Salinisphaera sp. LB1 TaxID=2183911 RepID=UPI000D707471|nr:O-antigen ligase family protein [Salinisphaera sp. LB1]AWN17506.1 pilin glycosylation enzyme, putative [Salinisphaera sp. LB1]
MLGKRFDMARHRAVIGVWLGIGWLMPIASGFDYRRTLLTVALCLAGASAAVAARKPINGVAGILLVAVFFLGAVSSAASPLPAWSALDTGYTLLLVVAATCALAPGLDALSPRPERLIAMAAFAPIALACIAAVVVIAASLLSGFGLRYPEPMGNYGNIRFFDQYQTWLLPFLPAAFALSCPLPRARRVFWWALVSVIAVFFWALYWRSDGRGTGYATALATLLVLLFCGHTGRRHAVAMAIFALGGYVVYGFMFANGASHAQHLLSASSDGRLYLWRIALDQILRHPLLGIGPMMFADIDTGLAAHPHNAILQFAAEWGVPATILIVAGIAWLLYRWLRFARRASRGGEHSRRWLVVALTASLFAGCIHALVSGVIVMPASQFMGATVCGLAFALYGASSRHQAIGALGLPSPTGRAVFALVILTAAAYTALFSYWHGPHRGAPGIKTNSVYLRNANEPRFWADGTLIGRRPRLPPDTIEQ